MRVKEKTQKFEKLLKKTDHLKATKLAESEIVKEWPSSLEQKNDLAQTMTTTTMVLKT